jgi:hypothetical protein
VKLVIKENTILFKNALKHIMKVKLSLFIVAIFFCISVFSQSTLAENDDWKRFKKNQIAKFNVPKEDSLTIVIPMQFNEAITNTLISNIPPIEIYSINLVYTQYKLSEQFNQIQLNEKRMNKLYQKMPLIKNNGMIKWLLTEQTDCQDKNSCLDFFHGIVIKLKDKVTIREFNLLDDYYNLYKSAYINTYNSKISKELPVGFIEQCDTVIKKVRSSNQLAKIKTISFESDYQLIKYLNKNLKTNPQFSLHFIYDKDNNLEFHPDYPLPIKQKEVLNYVRNQVIIKRAKYQNKYIDAEFDITFDFRTLKQIKTSQRLLLPSGQFVSEEEAMFTSVKTVQCKKIDTVTLRTLIYKQSPDLILKVLDRNKQWKNCLVVTDVTGSMYPYLAQFKLWHQQNIQYSTNRQFVFFNDGNRTPDKSKVMGKVGGVYFIKTAHFDSLINLMQLAMMRGNGGDVPENNIEAVLTGIKRGQQIKEVIMIADNMATPRDLDLLSQVRVPIRLILCGTHTGPFNVNYLNMIKKIKGSIHTIEEDLNGISSIKEGETLQLEGYKYVYKKGSFKLIESK